MVTRLPLPSRRAPAHRPAPGDVASHRHPPTIPNTPPIMRMNGPTSRHPGQGSSDAAESHQRLFATGSFAADRSSNRETRRGGGRSIEFGQAEVVDDGVDGGDQEQRRNSGCGQAERQSAWRPRCRRCGSARSRPNPPAARRPGRGPRPMSCRPSAGRSIPSKRRILFSPTEISLTLVSVARMLASTRAMARSKSAGGMRMISVPALRSAPYLKSG